MENNELFTGVIADPRLDPKVIEGWSIDEVLAESATVEWKEKTMSEVAQYPVWNQSSSGACVAFAKAKQISIKVFDMTGVWIDFSPASIYQLRANKTTSGMAISNANEIVNTFGATLEALMKSQNLNEKQINAVKKTKIGDLMAKGIAEAVMRYLYVPVDIERIAQTIESKRAVSMLIYATSDEYSRMRPIIINPSLKYAEAPIRHEVIGVDYCTDKNGVKIICINDSAHFGGIPIREFTKEFLEKRCILADAIDVFSFDPDAEENRPTYDGSIISLQKCLRFEGLFPNNVDYVEVLGPITKKAISDFQVRYKLHPTGTGAVGPATKAKLLELYP